MAQLAMGLTRLYRNANLQTIDARYHCPWLRYNCFVSRRVESIKFFHNIVVGFFYRRNAYRAKDNELARVERLLVI